METDMSKVEEVVKMLAKAAAGAEPPVMVFEMPCHISPEMDSNGDMMGEAYRQFGSALVHRASVITLRIGGREVVIKDRYGDRKDTLDSSDSSNAR